MLRIPHSGRQLAAASTARPPLHRRSLHTRARLVPSLPPGPGRPDPPGGLALPDTPSPARPLLFHAPRSAPCHAFPSKTPQGGRSEPGPPLKRHPPSYSVEGWEVGGLESGLAGCTSVAEAASPPLSSHANTWSLAPACAAPDPPARRLPTPEPPLSPHTSPPPPLPPNAEMSLLLRATGTTASPEPKFAKDLANETRGGGRGRGVRGLREAGAEAKAGIPRVGAAQAAARCQARLSMPAVCRRHERVRKPKRVLVFALHQNLPVEETLSSPSESSSGTLGPSQEDPKAQPPVRV